MTNQAPWSIKGVDAETRQKMKEIAQETGMTLGELIADLLEKNKNKEDSDHEEFVLEEIEHDTVPEKTQIAHTDVQPPKAQEIPQASKAQEIPQASKEKKSTRKEKSNPVAAQKAPALFETLLSKTMGRVPVTAQMPEDDLQNIVFESRHLREILRNHTQELAKELKNDIRLLFEKQKSELQSLSLASSEDGELIHSNFFNAETLKSLSDSLSSDLEKIFEKQKTDLQNFANMSPIASEYDAGSGNINEEILQEVHNFMTQTLQANIQEMKDYIYHTFARNTPTVSENTENAQGINSTYLQNFIYEMGKQIVGHFDEKFSILSAQLIQQSASQGADDSTHTGIMLSNIHQSMDAIVKRIGGLEQHYQNLIHVFQENQQNSENSNLGSSLADLGKLDLIQNQLQDFMVNIPSAIQMAMQNSQQDIQKLHGALENISGRLNNVETAQTQKQNFAPQTSQTHSDPVDGDKIFEALEEASSASQAFNTPNIMDKFKPTQPTMDTKHNAELQNLNNTHYEQNIPTRNQPTIPQTKIEADETDEEYEHVWDEHEHEHENEYEVTEADYDELGFNKEDDEHEYYDDVEDAYDDEEEDETPPKEDIRALDHASIMNKTRKHAVNQFNKRDMKSVKKGPTLLEKILGNQKDNKKKNALIIGGICVSAMGLMFLSSLF